MQKNLFDYVILFDKYETVDGKKTFVDTIVLKERTSVLAKNDKEVAFKATREVPEDYVSDSENVRIIIRPF